VSLRLSSRVGLFCAAADRYRRLPLYDCHCISILHERCTPEVRGSVGHVAGSLARVNVVNNKRTQYNSLLRMTGERTLLALLDV